jgi:hypothetical protein
LFLSVDDGHFKSSQYHASYFFSALADRLPNLEAFMIEGFRVSKESGSVVVAKFPKLKICLSLDEAYPVYVNGDSVLGNETGGWMWTSNCNCVQRFNKFGPMWLKAKENCQFDSTIAFFFN